MGDQGFAIRLRALVHLALVGGLAGVLTGCAPGHPQEVPVAAAPPTVPSQTPSIPSDVVPAAAPGPSMLPPAAPPQRISYPATGINLSVLPLTPSAGELAAGSLVPPMTMDAYWLTSYGQPGSGSSNTTYIVGHSWDSADAPFNRLSSQSAAGDELSISTATGTVKYRVQSVTTHDKNTLRTSDTWNNSPGRLVLISCFTADIRGKNVIVTALPNP